MGMGALATSGADSARCGQRGEYKTFADSLLVIDKKNAYVSVATRQKGRYTGCRDTLQWKIGDTESGDGGHANVYWFDTQAGPIVVDVPLTTSEAKKMRGKMIRPYRIYVTEADPVRFGGLAVMKNPDVPAYTTPAIATTSRSRIPTAPSSARSRSRRPPLRTRRHARRPRTCRNP